MPPHETSCEDTEEAIGPLLRLAKLPIDDYHAATLSNLTKLNLPECGLSTLPSSLGTVLPNLSILFCPKNDFEEIPAVIGSCKNLQMISFKSSRKPLTRIHPDALQPQLRWLILTDNQIAQLPNTIGRCTRLQKLMLSGNRLKTIPDEIDNCVHLELVRLASNQLTEPPMTLLKLPRLAWVGLSANPFLETALTTSTTIASDASLEVIQHYTQGAVLGQGASGITHKAVLDDGTNVAIKAYFGTMTSDGNPQEERRIALTASLLACPSLIHVRGQTKEGNLVMDLLQNVRVLANPPSMESCSRDVYDDTTSLPPTVARNLVTTLLEALLKLHSVGVCHGDFYGHNILLHDDTTSSGEDCIKLSDFGAAFAYDRNSEYGRCIETIELRAFGTMVEEVSVLARRSCSTATELDKDERVPNDNPTNDLCDELDSLIQTCQLSSTFQEVHNEWSKV